MRTRLTLAAAAVLAVTAVAIAGNSEVKVKKLGEFSVELLCAPWCKTEDYWGLYWDLNRLVKKRFDAEGVSFPFAHRDMHVYAEGARPSTDPSVASGGD